MYVTARRQRLKTYFGQTSWLGNKTARTHERTLTGGGCHQERLEMLRLFDRSQLGRECGSRRKRIGNKNPFPRAFQYITTDNWDQQSRIRLHTDANSRELILWRAKRTASTKAIGAGTAPAAGLGKYVTLVRCAIPERLTLDHYTGPHRGGGDRHV